MEDKNTEGTSDIFSIRPIGYIRSPYKDWAPYQPVEQEKGIGKFQVHVHEEYARGLMDLEHFAYVILIYYLDKTEKKYELTVKPPWTERSVGLFASRSPYRPNPIGISIVRLHKIEGNVVYTWPIDVFDETPLLDIKPYIATLDSKTDADDGWIEGLEGKEHLLKHVRGISHNHSEGH
jgi:tRNA-Thr(GGU) m(6)t(6)A37 methyltransferase TsaA